MLIFISLFSFAGPAVADNINQSKVKLVLQITVDGLKADLLNRYRNGFGEGGFNYLITKGAYYTNAHYQYANTETIVGYFAGTADNYTERLDIRCTGSLLRLPSWNQLFSHLSQNRATGK